MYVCLQKPAVVANKILTDFKLSNSDKLGQTRKLGTGDRPIGPDHVFGVPSLRNGVREPSVEELLKTSLPPEQQQPDADLGKSLREVGYTRTRPRMHFLHTHTHTHTCAHTHTRARATVHCSTALVVPTALTFMVEQMAEATSPAPPVSVLISASCAMLQL